jgi:hypothetical protein
MPERTRIVGAIRRFQVGRVVSGPGESILDDDFTPVRDEDGDVTTDLCPVCGRDYDESNDHTGCDDE